MNLNGISFSVFFANLSPHMKPIDVSRHQEFDGHEVVLQINDPAGLHAFIAIHRFFFHPHLLRPSALGGTRITDGDALTEALRLSRAMSSKAAWAKTDFGGGKAVIMRKPEDRDAPISPEMENILSAYAYYMNLLRGHFVTAEDSGFFEKYISFMRGKTSWVAGGSIASGGSGDPSPHTAHGVYLGIKECLFALPGGSRKLKGIRVAIQGVGGVGLSLAKLLQADGAHLFIADKDDAQIERARQALGSVSVVSPEKIHAVQADVFAPCALGAILNERTISELACGIVAGGANNQLATPEDGLRLHKRGILYAPDFVLNAVGLMRVAREYDPSFKDSEEDAKKTAEQLEVIPRNLARIFRESAGKKVPPSVVADEIAQTIIAEKIAERELRMK